MRKHEKSNQLKYTQQHLANERTYLAWIRTAVAIIGIGFLATSLHFSSNQLNSDIVNFSAITLGISTGIFGMLTIIMATISFIKKKRQIENQSFYTHYLSILLTSALLLIIAMIAMVYVLFKWGIF